MMEKKNRLIYIGFFSLVSFLELSQDVVSLSLSWVSSVSIIPTLSFIFFEGNVNKRGQKGNQRGNRAYGASFRNDNERTLSLRASCQRVPSRNLKRIKRENEGKTMTFRERDDASAGPS